MALSRKSRRATKRSARKGSRKGRKGSRKQRGGAQIDTFFLMNPSTGELTNFYTTNPALNLSSAGRGKVNIASTDPSIKITGIAIHGMKGPAAAWPADAALGQATGYSGTKLVLSKGASSLTSTGRSSFLFNSGGTVVKDSNLNISGIYGTAVWGTANPDGTGAPAPAGATGGSGNVNVRIRFTTA